MIYSSNQWDEREMTVAKKPVNQTVDAEFEPASEIAYLFPAQGQWSEAEYIALDNRAPRRIELVDGRIEVLAVPTELHQLIVAFLYKTLDKFVARTQTRPGARLWLAGTTAAR